MNLIQNTIQSLLPSKRKQTPSGWISFDAPCCHHRGQRADSRQRGGMLFSGDGFQYHCFNCSFKAGWSPAKLLSKNTKSLLKWLGLPDIEIQKLNLEALKNKNELPKLLDTPLKDLVEKELPKESKSLIDWISDKGQFETYENELTPIVEYIYTRGMKIDWYPWHWSPEPGYKDRIIIPFYDKEKIVGYTGRKITDGKPKYLTDSQPGYVFNIDRQTYDRKFVILAEGQFDAIAVDGCAVMSNDPSDQQIMRLKSLQKEIIVVPDRDAPGAKLIEAALEHGWSVSMPPWGEDIKDIADVVKKYGRLYALTTILHYKETNEIKIQLLKKKLEAANG